VVESQSRRTSQSILGSSIDQPFRDAAPGSPEAPGGTQKRQNSYLSQSSQNTDAHPMRRADIQSRQTSVYAHEYDYYPITPILPGCIDDDSQPQPSPSRKDSYSISQSASSPGTSHQDEPHEHLFNHISSGPYHRQCQSLKASHIQKDVPINSRAPTLQTKTDVGNETPRTIEVPFEQDLQGPVRRDFCRQAELRRRIAKGEAAPREGAQSPETRQNLCRIP
jgi:hypothetical protein